MNEEFSRKHDEYRRKFVSGKLKQVGDMLNLVVNMMKEDHRDDLATALEQAQKIVEDNRKLVGKKP